MRRVSIAFLLGVSLLVGCDRTIQRREAGLDSMCSAPTPHAYTLRANVWVGCVSTVPKDNTFCCPK